MSSQQSLFPTLAEVLEKENKLKIEKALAIKGAFESNDVNEIYQAQSYLRKIEEREVIPQKSFMVDPLDMYSTFGYKEKPFNLSFPVLRAMGTTHVVKAIRETRKEQVSNFCTPQENKFSAGFVIQKKRKYADMGKPVKQTKADQAKVEWMIEYLLGCGTANNFWHGDTFETFVSKILDDSLVFDQGTAEVVRNKKGDIVEFFATDASTYRIADTYNDGENDTKFPEKIVQGYAPSYVQIYQSKVQAEFYPWELMYGIRNPQTDIRYNGYGKSELEDMMLIVTSILNADSYNANFFKVGSAPKGILKYSGNINQNTIEDFRRQWVAQVAGVMNAHKIPVINADKMDFINTNVPNKDMEFSRYQEFLIKITCALYKIDPSEIGFSMSGNSEGQSGLGGDATKEKQQQSKDKGLKPLLKKIQYWINKWIIWQIDPEYEFRFVGIDQEEDEETDLDRDIKMLESFMTLNEIRAKRDLDPVENGDVPLNPVYVQLMGMNQQQDQYDAEMDMQGQQMDQDGNQDTDEGSRGADADNTDEGEDPFMKSLAKDLEVLLCS